MSKLNFFTKNFNLYCDRLIDINPNSVCGHILNGLKFCQFLALFLMVQSRSNEALRSLDQIFQKFPKFSMIQFFQSLYLFLQEKYHDAYLLLNQLQDDFFESPLHKLALEIIFLLKYQNMPLAFERLFQKYQDQSLFYLTINQFCLLIQQFEITEQAIYFIEGFKDEIPQGSNNFYHVLRGKLLIDYGQKLKDNKMIEEALIHLNEYSYDYSSQPYRYYYSGQALMFLSRLEEAADCFKKSLGTDQSFQYNLIEVLQNLSVCEFMQGLFDQAYESFQLIFEIHKFSFVYFKFQQFMFGIIYFLYGFNEMSLQKLDKITQFPLIDFIISWIYVEQGNIEEAENLLLNLYSQFPQFKFFCEKYTFISSGPFSTYISENKQKFDNYDNKTFFTLKTVAFYLETQGTLQLHHSYISSFIQICIYFLIMDVQRSSIQIYKSSLQNYPFM